MSINLSVITATYNCADTVGECLSSVASQTYSAIEHLVIDGTSTDGTLERLEQHRVRIATLVSEPDHGIYDALNKGISKSTGDVIGFLHADDLYANDHVLSAVAVAFETPKAQAVYGDLQYVSRVDTNSVIRYWRAGEFCRTKLARGWMPPHPAVFLRREVYEQFGGFNTRYRIAADYDFMLHVLRRLQPEQVVYIPEVLIKMRVGGLSNRSLKTVLRKSREDYQVLRANEFGSLAALKALAWKNLSKLGQFWSAPSR